MELLDTALFIIFRLASALVLSATAGYILWHQLFTDRLKPSFVWSYAGVVLLIVAGFRWLVVVALLPMFSEFYRTWEYWFQPLTQTGYVLLGMVILVLTFTHIKARARHEREWHAGEDDD